MAEAKRIPAADKAPEDFTPPALPLVVKKFVQVTVTRKGGEVEAVRFILRSGDVLAIDGQTVAEG